MATFRLHLIGKCQPVEVEFAAGSIDALDEMASCRCFIVGRLTTPDEDGVLAGVMIATSRIECVSEAS